MVVTLVVVGLVLACVMLFVRVQRRRNQTELEQHSISVEQLRSLTGPDRKVLLFDVRQPLDLLAYPELIAGAHRIPPQEALDNPSLIPRNEDVVVYCTCPGDKTSRIILRRALQLGFTRIKFLTGGLSAWKTSGYPVEPYNESFRLSTPSAHPPAR